MSIAFEHDDLNKIITNHRRRLLVLRLRQAAQGMDTPAEVINEIAQIEREIERLTDQAVEQTERERYLVEQQWRMRVDGDLYQISRRVDEVYTLLFDLLEALAKQGVRPRKRHAAPRVVNGGD